MGGVSVTADEVPRTFAYDRPTSVAPQNVAFVQGYRGAMKFVRNRADDSDFEWHSALILDGLTEYVKQGWIGLRKTRSTAESAICGGSNSQTAEV